MTRQRGESFMFTINGIGYQADNIIGVVQVSENEVEVRYPKGTVVIKDTSAGAVMSAIEKAKSERR